MTEHTAAKRIAPTAGALQSTVEESGIQTMTVGSSSFTPSFVELAAAEMRQRFEEKTLPAYMIKDLEAVPGWTWVASTRAAVLADWQVRADSELAKGATPNNELVDERVEGVLEIVDQWLGEGDQLPLLADALAALTDDDVRSVIRVPEDTVRIAAIQWLMQADLESALGLRSDQEELAGTRHFPWVHNHYERMYGLALPQEADGRIMAMDDPLGADTEAHLVLAITTKLAGNGFIPSSLTTLRQD
ncbi:MAG: hypothetical protein ABSG62_24000 [Terracidiphilus sp.]